MKSVLTTSAALSILLTSCGFELDHNSKIEHTSEIVLKNSTAELCMQFFDEGRLDYDEMIECVEVANKLEAEVGIDDELEGLTP